MSRYPTKAEIEKAGRKGKRLEAAGERALRFLDHERPLPPRRMKPARTTSRIRALEAQCEMQMARAEKAEAGLAAAIENAVIAGAHDRATCEWCANHFGRAAGRDSGGQKR